MTTNYFGKGPSKNKFTFVSANFFNFSETGWRAGMAGWDGGLADRSLGTVVLADTHKQSGLSHTYGLSGLSHLQAAGARCPAPGGTIGTRVPGSQPSSTLHFFF